MNDKPEILALTADIVAAFVGKNPISPADLRAVINDVYRALSENASGYAAARSLLAKKIGLGQRRKKT